MNNADFLGAFLNGAILDKASLFGAEVTKEQLSNAKSLKETLMPDGSTHP